MATKRERTKGLFPDISKELREGMELLRSIDGTLKLIYHRLVDSTTNMKAKEEEEEEDDGLLETGYVIAIEEEDDNEDDNFVYYAGILLNNGKHGLIDRERISWVQHPKDAEIFSSEQKANNFIEVLVDRGLTRTIDSCMQVRRVVRDWDGKMTLG